MRQVAQEGHSTVMGPSAQKKAEHLRHYLATVERTIPISQLYLHTLRQFIYVNYSYVRVRSKRLNLILHQV